MSEYARLVLLGLFFQTYCFMTVVGGESREKKYVLEEYNVLASNPSNVTSVESRSLCALECEIEQFCVAFAFNEDGGECYLYDRDINGEVYDESLNTNIYINNQSKYRLILEHRVLSDVEELSCRTHSWLKAALKMIT